MTEHDDDADARADSFLSELIPQVADRLAARHASDYDASAGQERFAAWLAAHTKGKPAPRRRADRGPARPGRRLGRWLRMCAGIREDVVDWVPEERVRYTGLGIIILNTAWLAAFAMFTALNTILAAAVALVPAALWGWVIFSADRWLISSTHGVPRVNRLLTFLPRVALAAVLAFTIAEPLTLHVFQNALDTQVRATQLDTYASRLQACNPVSGQWASPATCNGYDLNVPGSPYAIQQKLATERQQQTQLQQAVSADLTQDQKLITIAQSECAGTAGPDTTGVAGNGPICRADLAAAHAFGQQSGLAAKQAQLAALQTSVAGMIQQAGIAQQAYATRLHAAITNAVTEKSKELAGQHIGILDEWSALQQLSTQNTSVSVGHWLLVLLLVALSCLPVLTKFINGSTAYDKMLAAQIASDERIYQADLLLREKTATADKEIKTHIAEIAKRTRILRLDQEELLRNAKDGTDLHDVMRLLTDLLARAETAAASKEPDTGSPRVLTAQGPRDAGDSSSP